MLLETLFPHQALRLGSRWWEELGDALHHCWLQSPPETGKQRDPPPLHVVFGVTRRVLT